MASLIPISAELEQLLRNPNNALGSGIPPNPRPQPQSQDATYVFPPDMSAPSSASVFFHSGLSELFDSAPSVPSRSNHTPLQSTRLRGDVAFSSNCRIYAEEMGYTSQRMMPIEHAQESPGPELDTFDSCYTVLSSSAVWDEYSGEYLLTPPREVPLSYYYTYAYPVQLEALDYWEERLVSPVVEEVPTPTTSSSNLSSDIPSTPKSPMSASSAFSRATSVESLIENNESEDPTPGATSVKNLNVNNNEDLDQNLFYIVSRRKGLIWYKCKACHSRKATHKLTEMIRHGQSKAHKPQSFECSVCEVKFTRQDSLVRHYRAKSHIRLAKKKGRYNLRKRVGRK